MRKLLVTASFLLTLSGICGAEMRLVYPWPLVYDVAHSTFAKPRVIQFSSVSVDAAMSTITVIPGFYLFDEGSFVGFVSSMNCTGSGITCSGSPNGVLNITATGGGGGGGALFVQQDNGSLISISSIQVKSPLKFDFFTASGALTLPPTAQVNVWGIGIGTTAPIANLHVSSHAGSNALLLLVSTGPSALFRVMSSSAIFDVPLIASSPLTVWGPAQVNGQLQAFGGITGTAGGIVMSGAASVNSIADFTNTATSDGRGLRMVINTTVNSFPNSSIIAAINGNAVTVFQVTNLGRTSAGTSPTFQRVFEVSNGSAIVRGTGAQFTVDGGSISSVGVGAGLEVRGVVILSSLTVLSSATINNAFTVLGDSNTFLVATHTVAGLKWVYPNTTCTDGQLWKFDNNGVARCAGDDTSAGGGGDVSGTTTTRLNNLDASTAAISARDVSGTTTTRLNNLDLSTAALANYIASIASEAVSGGGGGVKSLYLRLGTLDPLGFNLMFTTPSTGVETSQAITVAAANGLVSVSSHITVATGLGQAVNKIPAGFFQFIMFAKEDSLVGVTDLILDVSTVSRTGTNKFRIVSATIPNINSTVYQIYDGEAIIRSDISISTDDRILVEIFAKTTSALARTITLAYEGVTNASRLATSIERNPTFVALDDTPSNYVGASGKVPQVNATESALEFVNIGTTTLFQASQATGAALSNLTGAVSASTTSLSARDVSGTTTTRLNNLDFSTSMARSNLNNIVSTNIVNGTIVAADVAASVFLSSDTSGASEGSYTNTNLTVDRNGRITAASNGAGGVAGDVSGTTTTRLNNLDASTSTIYAALQATAAAVSRSTDIWSFSWPNIVSSSAPRVYADTDTCSGQAMFDNNRSTLAGNWARYLIPLSTGMKLSADPNLDNFMVFSTATDPSPISFILSIATVSTNANPATIVGSSTTAPIVLPSFTNSSGAGYRQSDRVILTGWRNILQAGGGMAVIQVGRDTAGDTSLINACSQPFQILMPIQK